MDSMTSGLSTGIRDVTLDDYNWGVLADLIPVSYLFEDYRRYSSIVRPCIVSDSIHGTMMKARCTYHIPIYGWVIFINLLWAFVLGPFIINFVSYVKAERGNRGLPWNFLFNRLYWQSKYIRPMEGGI